MLTTSVERLENNTVKLTVTVPAEKVDEQVEKTYKDLGRKYRFPGFRRGKAPKAVVEQRLGREYILGEATEAIVNDSYALAIDAEQLRPIESPEMEALDMVEPGQDYTFVVEVEVRPEIELTDYEPFEVILPERAATQDDIDRNLDQLRDQYASLEPVEDRSVTKTDFVLISFVGTLDGEPYEDNVADKFLYEMGSGQMPPDFEMGLLGAKTGDERHIEFVISDEAPDPRYRGKMAGFDVTVHEIKAKVLPEVDDEFAATAGGFDSVDELLEDVKFRVEKQKGAAFERLMEQRIREHVAALLESDPPPAMILQRQQSMMRDFFSMLERNHLSLEDYLASANLGMDVFERDMRVRGEQTLREELALEAVFRHQGMEVTEEDIAAEFEKIAAEYELTPEATRERWEALGLIGVMREDLMHRKAYDWLKENVTIVEKSVEELQAEAAERMKAAAEAAKAAAAARAAEAEQSVEGEESAEDAAAEAEADDAAAETEE